MLSVPMYIYIYIYTHVLKAETISFEYKIRHEYCYF